MADRKNRSTCLLISETEAAVAVAKTPHLAATAVDFLNAVPVTDSAAEAVDPVVSAAAAEADSVAPAATPARVLAVGSTASTSLLP